ncbi:MAG TPA: T9SS type A sorting domain-containing protein, partial [Candidatus Paceibacterota bacterium]
SASVTFVATTNDGGSAIIGYNVISNPTGGTDINDGSTSLNHTITGLTNGTSYSFLVKAINPVGSSSYSVASNSITIATGITNLDDGVKIVVFPNPCHGRFTVRFSEIPISESRIEVLNLSGRKVTSQIIIGISQEIDLFGQAPGMYFVKSILGSIEKINKLVIQ